MRIVSWNCNGGLRKKLEPLEGLDADVIVVQECENPAESTRAYQEWAGEYLWCGDNKNKGVGVFARKGNKARALDWDGEYTHGGVFNQSNARTWNAKHLKLFQPCLINDAYTLLAVWTKGKGRNAFNYIVKCGNICR